MPLASEEAIEPLLKLAGVIDRILHKSKDVRERDDYIVLDLVAFWLIDEPKQTGVLVHTTTLRKLEHRSRSELIREALRLYIRARANETTGLSNS